MGSHRYDATGTETVQLVNGIQLYSLLVTEVLMTVISGKTSVLRSEEAADKDAELGTELDVPMCSPGRDNRAYSTC